MFSVGKFRIAGCVCLICAMLQAKRKEPHTVVLFKVAIPCGCGIFIIA